MYINIKFKIFIYSGIKCTYARLLLYIIFRTPGILVLNLNEQQFHNICKNPFKGKLEALDVGLENFEGVFTKEMKNIYIGTM